MGEFPCLGIIQYNKQSTERAKDDVKRVLHVLNTVLKTRTYLVGERITQADITVACALFHLYRHVLEPQFRAPYQNTNRWFTTLINQPQFKAIIGTFKLCDKMAQFDAKKFAELTGKGKKDDKKAAKPQAKKQEAKKEEKKPAAPPAEEKKAVNHLQVHITEKCPVSTTFVMDDWKKLYRNEPYDVSLDWFFKNLDLECYSVWYGTYNYNSDLKMTFMSMNLVNGMFQRLDKMRKYAMGAMSVFGTNNNNAIAGVWVMRGQEALFNVDPDLNIDAESYTWRKMDIKNEDDKRIISEHFKFEGKFPEMEGKALEDGGFFV